MCTGVWKGQLVGGDGLVANANEINVEGARTIRDGVIAPVGCLDDMGALQQD